MNTTLRTIAVSALLFSVGCTLSTSIRGEHRVASRAVSLQVGKMPVPSARHIDRPLVVVPFEGHCRQAPSAPLAFNVKVSPDGATDVDVERAVWSDAMQPSECELLHESVMSWLGRAEFPVWQDIPPTRPTTGGAPADAHLHQSAPATPRDDYIVVRTEVVHIDSGRLASAEQPGEPSGLRARVTLYDAYGAALDVIPLDITVQAIGLSDRPIDVLGNHVALALAAYFNADVSHGGSGPL